MTIKIKSIKQEIFLNKFKKLKVKKNSSLKYYVIKYTSDIQDTDTKFNIILYNKSNPKEFITKFNTEIEGTFKAIKGDYLIKGPLGELYNIGTKDRLFNKYTRNSSNIKESKEQQKKSIKIGDIFYPILDNSEYKVIKITKNILKEINNNNDLFMKNEFGLPTIFVKYGGNINGNTHIIKEKDYIMICNNNLYRIYGPAFDLTYIVI